MIITEHIGIDPDVDKSGVAVWNGKQITSLSTMEFFDVISMLQSQRMHTEVTDNRCIIYIEGGWLNQPSNFHSKETGSRRREKIAKNVGANHQIGKLFVEYCKRIGLDYVVLRPEQRKWDCETFKKITGWEGRTNSETRDAARLVFGRKNPYHHEDPY